MILSESDKTAVYASVAYDVIEGEMEGFDAVYEDFVVNLVGTFGLNTLRMYRLIESCGVLNGRQLYVLTKKES